MDYPASEYWGTFFQALLTLFQILTGDSWAASIARPVVYGYTSPLSTLAAGLFFVSFVIIGSFILFNVVVAVLLEKVISHDEAHNDELPSVAEATPQMLRDDLHKLRADVRATASALQALTADSARRDEQLTAVLATLVRMEAAALPRPTNAETMPPR